MGVQQEKQRVSNVAQALKNPDGSVRSYKEVAQIVLSTHGIKLNGCIFGRAKALQGLSKPNKMPIVMVKKPAVKALDGDINNLIKLVRNHHRLVEGLKKLLAELEQ